MFDKIESQLGTSQWIGGVVPSNEDNDAFQSLTDVPNPDTHPSTFAWYMLVVRFSDNVRQAWPSSSQADSKIQQKGGKKDDQSQQKGAQQKQKQDAKKQEQPKKQSAPKEEEKKQETSKEITKKTDDSKAVIMDALRANEPTHKEYFDKTYLFKYDAKIIDVFPAPEGLVKEVDNHIIVLDKTIFHPQGGGQPNDEGVMRLKSCQEHTFKVNHIVEKANVIYHVGKFSSVAAQQKMTTQASITCEVNEERRRIYARMHSAGHLLDVAMTRAGRTDLKPSKGYHFDVGAYVEYVGEVDAKDRESLVAKINEIANQIITHTKPEVTVFKKICSYQEAQKELEKAGGVPDYIPNGQSLRVLKLTPDDLGCPCGGTHVDHISEIKKLEVTKIKKQGKSIRVSYVVKEA